MSSNDSEQSKRVGVRIFWPILLVVFLALLVFLVMSRPCEWFRLRIVIFSSDYNWTETVSGRFGQECAVWSQENPMWAMEKDFDALGNRKNNDIIPLVTF